MTKFATINLDGHIRNGERTKLHKSKTLNDLKDRLQQDTFHFALIIFVRLYF